MADSNVIVGLDIGTTKILCLVAEVRAPGDVEIIGVSSYPSKGLQRGIVLNIDFSNFPISGGEIDILPIFLFLFKYILMTTLLLTSETS